MKEKNETNWDLVECVRCGRNGKPPTDCRFCGGNAPVQERAYTLSEVRAGKAPKDDRYGVTGNVGPKIAILPGSVGSEQP